MKLEKELGSEAETEETLDMGRGRIMMALGPLYLAVPDTYIGCL